MQLRRFALAALTGTAAVLWLHPASGRADQCGFVLNCTSSSATTPTTAPPVTAPPATVPPTPVTTPAKPAPGVDSAGAAQLLDLVNQARAQAGVGGLVMRGDIVSIAVGHSEDMARQQLLFHNDTYFTSAVRSSLGAGALGENVDMNFNIPAVNAAFLGSPHHFANMVDPRFTAVGIGVVIDSSGDYWVTEDFAQIRGLGTPAVRTAARPSPAPAGPAHPGPAVAPRLTVAAPPAAPTTAATDASVPAPGSSLGGSIAALAGPPEAGSITMRHTGGAGSLFAGLAAAVLLAVAGGTVLTPGFNWRRLG